MKIFEFLKRKKEVEIDFNDFLITELTNQNIDFMKKIKKLESTIKNLNRDKQKLLAEKTNNKY